MIHLDCLSSGSLRLLLTLCQMWNVYERSGIPEPICIGTLSLFSILPHYLIQLTASWGSIHNSVVLLPSVQKHETTDLKLITGLQSSCHLQRTPLCSAMMLNIDKLRLSKEVQQSPQCRYRTDSQAYPALLAASQQEQLQSSMESSPSPGSNALCIEASPTISSRYFLASSSSFILTREVTHQSCYFRVYLLS